MPSCGYQAQDMIDDDIGDKTSEFSSLINNPSAEGFLPTVKSSLTAPPTWLLRDRRGRWLWGLGQDISFLRQTCVEHKLYRIHVGGNV